MKWMLLLFLAFPVAQSSAQNIGKQYEWVKLAPEQMPVKSNDPYYDIDIPMDDEGASYTREQLDANANYYFNNVFSSSMVKNVGKHSFSGISSYSFSINKTPNTDDIYTVTYILDISTKNGRYNMTMHSFKLTHVDLEVDLSKRIAAAGKNDMVSKKIIASMHMNNLAELKKAYVTMMKNSNSAPITASK